MIRASFFFFFFNDTATTEIYTLSYTTLFRSDPFPVGPRTLFATPLWRHCLHGRWRLLYGRAGIKLTVDRKSTRLNSSHDQISYAVFCLKKKKKHRQR